MKPTMNYQLTNSSSSILCGYANTTSQLQILRIVNIANWYFERVIFPGQRLLFEAKPDAELEIYASDIANAIMMKKIPCSCLRVDEVSSN